MIHYDSLQLEIDNLFTVLVDCACGHPKGCAACCGMRAIPEVADLSILLRNVAIAGALCEAWKQHWYTWTLACSYWEPGCGQSWSRAP